MQEYQAQGNNMVFALDIGTRSIVGVVGEPQGEKLKVLAIESAEHSSRSMIDGQIDNIRQVAELARTVTKRLEERLGVSLKRVCVAAAGRALQTQKGSFELEVSAEQMIDAELISRLEAGAVSSAEEKLQESQEDWRQLFLVGYTVAQYRLDNYPLNALLDHKGKRAEVDVVATFLPGEVVESLYAAMNAAGLQVVSMTLEPIAAMNAAIPAELRLLNLALVDIGAGTTDIAICRDGSVVGYTMATIAGDEITEAIMRAFLVNFSTAEEMKRTMKEGETIRYQDILGLENTISYEELFQAIQEPMDRLAQAIAQQVLQINTTAPSAVFLAGGGSKLSGLPGKVARSLNMDERRVAIAGNNFEKSAWSDDLVLQNPEYATPLGIAISAGLGLLNDSYVMILNGQPAKLFRSGVLTVRDVLLMNGYTYKDMIGRNGRSLTVTMDGRRVMLRGEPAVPAILTINGAESTINTVVRAGDHINFIPARSGADAEKTLGELVGEDFSGRILVNNQEMPPDTPLHNNDVVLTLEITRPSADAEPPREEAPAETAAKLPEAAAETPQVIPNGKASEITPSGKSLEVILNGRPLVLPPKEDGQPYYLMDLLQHSGIDFEKLDRPVQLSVNGEESSFQHVLKPQDRVTICRI